MNRIRIVLAASVLVACSHVEPAPDLFSKAETLCLDQDWSGAQPKLREFLLANPEHAGAHFYLGRAYLFGPDFRPAVAEGELQLALELFHESGRVSPIERFNEDYFEIICNVESIKVIAMEISALSSRGIPMASMEDRIERMRTYIERARAIKSDFADVIQYDEIVKEFELALQASRQSLGRFQVVPETDV